jgi:hypothetical protein
MGRMKAGIALAGVVVALLGVVAAVTMRSDGSAEATKVASQGPASTVAAVGSTVAPGGSEPAAASSPATTAKPSGATATTKASPTAPARSGSPSTVSQPSVQDIQQLIAGIQAQITAPSATPGSTAPLTAEQIEARIREELKTKYGITY